MIVSDLETVATLEKEIFGDDAYNLDQLKYELLENPIATILVACVDSKIVGYLDFSITFDSSTINHFAVKSNFRKKGIGNLLIGEMVKLCKSSTDVVEFITLEVRKSNDVAHRFYKRHAFEDITIKPAYYQDGEDAIYMVRSIVND